MRDKDFGVIYRGINNREWNYILGEKHLGTGGEQERPVK